MGLKKLEQSLGLGSVIAISVSTMLGSGIFVLPGIAIATTGPSAWLAYLLAGICILPAAASKSELATAMPTSGGTYVYIERTFGPMAGTIAGFGLWPSLLLKSAFALVGLGAYLSIFTDINVRYVSIGTLIFITLLNIFGVGKVSTLLIVVISLCIFSLLGLTGMAFSSPLFSVPKEPFMSHGTMGLMEATALVFISFTGVTKVAAIAEEIKSPEKNLPRGIFVSLLMVTLLYVLVNFTLVHIVPLETLNYNIRPIYLLGDQVLGQWGGLVIAAIAILTTSSMGNAGLLAASRFPFAMSRDKLLPSKIGRLHPRFLTPVTSILISALIIGMIILLIDVEKIAKLASAFMLMVYMIENVAVIVLREARVQWYKPTYRTPFYPGIQIFGIITTLALLLSMGFIVIPSLLSISIPGVLLYYFYSRKRTKRKGVLGMRGKRQDLVENKLEASPTPVNLEIMEIFNLNAKGIVVLFGKERSPEMLIEVGTALSEQGNLEVAHITEVPEQTDLDDIVEEPAELRSLRRRVAAMAMEKKRTITFDPVVSHDITKTIFHLSERFHCEWLLIEWKGKSAGSLTFHDPIGWLKEHLHCNLGIFRCMGVHYIRKIMVLLKGDNNDDLAIKTADQLAGVNGAEIVIFHFIQSNCEKIKQTQVQKDLNKKAFSCMVKAEGRILTGENIASTVLEATVEFDLFVFGHSKYSPWRHAFGTLDDIFMSKAACSVISVQSYSTTS